MDRVGISAAPPRRKGGAQVRRCCRAGPADQWFPTVPKPHHRAPIHTIPATEAAGNGGDEGAEGEGSRTSDLTRRGSPRHSHHPPPSHHPRGRERRPGPPTDAAAAPRAAAPDPESSVRNRASRASPPPSPATAQACRRLPRVATRRGRGGGWRR